MGGGPARALLSDSLLHCNSWGQIAPPTWGRGFAAMVAAIAATLAFRFHDAGKNCKQMVFQTWARVHGA